MFDYIKLAQLNGSSARTYDPSFSSGKTLPRVTGEVEFRDLTFAYPTRPEQRVLNGLSLKVPAGKVVALCGHSGVCVVLFPCVIVSNFECVCKERNARWCV